MTNFFATADNVCINTTLAPKYFSGILNWAIALDKEEQEAPKLPPAPEPPELNKYEDALALIVRNFVDAGLKAARKIGHDPIGPHMPKTARPGASTFRDFPLSPLHWDKEAAIIIRSEGGPGVRIFVVSPESYKCGTERTTLLIDEESYTMKEVHGWLQPVGVVKTEAKETDRLTVVFTYEGNETGWVLASAYPGEPDPPANRDTLAEGQILTGAELKKLGFVRAVPSEE